MERATCTCDPLKAQDERDNYTYPRTVPLELPLWSKARQYRLQQGLPTHVDIDGCIVEEIKKLWDRGIETRASCCGHNYLPAMVAVDADCFEAMFALGYQMKMPEVINDSVKWLYTFYL